jgi:hypothetical protein
MREKHHPFNFDASLLNSPPLRGRRFFISIMDKQGTSFACRFISFARVDRRVRPWVMSLALKNSGEFDRFEATK